MIGPALARAAGAELMDEADVEAAELARTLSDLRRVNRLLGGRRSVFRHLLPMIRRVAAAGRTPVRVLDVATGSGDLPLALASWGRARGLPLAVTATDSHPGTLAFARAHTAADAAVRVAQADALDLPFADGEFDLAFCSTALHHFDPYPAIRVLREAGRVAAHGLVVSDLRRSVSALVGAHLLAATLWRRSRLTRHDGPLSVRRAYTPEELAMLGHAAGMPDARVYTHLPFRLALVRDRTRGLRR